MQAEKKDELKIVNENDHSLGPVTFGYKDFLIKNDPEVLKVVLVDEKAVLPSKGEPEAVGYDLTAIKLIKALNDNTWLYDTGVKIEPPEGYYTEIVPRSSIVKTGFILANSTGVIENGYRGNLMIAISRIDGKKEPLETPFKLFQLILRKQYSLPVQQVPFLSETKRGEGGFGSTDKK